MEKNQKERERKKEGKRGERERRVFTNSNWTRGRND